MFEEIITLLKNKLGEFNVDLNSTPKSIWVKKELLVPVCTELQQNASTFFDMLSCLTGVDNGPEAGTMEVIYNLYSVPFNFQLMLKVTLPRNEPEIETVSHIWKTADWHEREVFDMYGIKFTGHPDLRRILLPADWEGYPLRKDYKQQDYYRGIKVEY